MKFNTILILIGVFLSLVLIIENMIVPLRAYVLIWNTYTWALAFTAIFAGILIGYGLRGKLTETPTTDDDSFNF